MPISMTQGSSKYYLHYDQVGSLRAVTDSSHNIVKEVIYDSFGNILSDSNESFSVPFGFAGGLLDRDTGLTRFGFRDYDSYTGKWTAKDPIDFSGGDSNLYGYILNDPINGIDELGLFDVGTGGGLNVGGHLGLIGASIHIQYIYKCGEGYAIISICGRLGVGLYFSGGLEGVVSLSGNGYNSGNEFSVGVGFDGGAGIGGIGGGIGFNGFDISSTVNGKGGVSVGGSVGIDVCYTKERKL